MQGAIGVSVSYIRLRRWRTTLPEDASTGEAPHRLANEASLPNLSGLSPAVSKKRCGVIRTDSRKGDQLWSHLGDQAIKLRI